MRILKFMEIYREFVITPKTEKRAFVILFFKALYSGYGHSKESRIFERLLYTTEVPYGKWSFGRYSLKYLKSQYSADFQDVLISYLHGKKGIFIEVGASDGIRKSNCFLLENFGWNGLAVEGNPIYFDNLATNRKCILVLRALISEQVQNMYSYLEFHPDMPSSGNLIEIPYEKLVGLGSKKLIRVDTISVNDLVDIFVGSFNTYCNYISIDIEESSHRKLTSFLNSKIFFDFISIEHNNISSVEEAIRTTCLSAGYIEVYKNFTRNESIFCHEKIYKNIFQNNLTH